MASLVLATVILASSGATWPQWGGAARDRLYVRDGTSVAAFDVSP